MNRNYLTLNRYDGSITGLQDTPAGPNDIVSPGGLATIQHHWSQGMGGIGDRTPDVFAGTGERYPSGIYGNLYHPDSHGSVHERHYGPHTINTEDKTLSNQPYHWQTKTPSTVENFTEIKTEPIELLDDPTDTTSKPQSSAVSSSSNSRTISAYFLLLIFLIAFITFDFWSEAVHRFIHQKLNKGMKASWKQYTLYAIVATMIFLITIYFVGIPLRDIETSSLLPPF